MRQGVRTKVSLLICILLLSTFACLFNVNSTKGHWALTDWWSSFHHDPSNTGHSISAAPLTNQTIWNYTTGDLVVSSPAVANGVVFAGSSDNNVYALNASDGSSVWNYTTGDWVVSSPAVANGVVFVGSIDGNLYAFATTPTYDVTFVESGLASGTSWSVTFNGATQASTSASISFTVPNGIYAYSVSVPSGYTSPSTLSGTLTVDDANVIKNIVFTPISPPSYTLTMLVVGEGTVSPGNGTYVQGTNVSLEAIDADGWTFSGWSGSASGTGNTTIIMDSSKTVTATFTQNEVIPEFPAVFLLSVFLIVLSAIVVAVRKDR